MTKKEVIEIFATDFNDPGSVKSGEYLEYHVLAHAKQIANVDRQALIEVLSDWLAARVEPHTMLAVKIAGELRLWELYKDLTKLREDVLAGRVFLRFYVRRIDKALDGISKGGDSW